MQQQSQSRAQEHTLIGIEVARFACAVAVLLWHYQHFQFVGSAASVYQPDQQPLSWLLWPFYRHGSVAVQVFWTISGFIFYYKYAESIALGKVAAKRFAILRFTRLYPLHIGTLLLVALLQWRYTAAVGSGFVYSHQDAGHFVLQLLLASDWKLFEQGHSYNGPIWSISAEVVVYALFFALCRLQVTKAWMMALIMTGAGAASGLGLTLNPIVYCICFFYLGALTCLVYREFAQRWSRRALLVVSGAGLLLALACLRVPRIGQLSPLILAVPLSPLFIVFLLCAARPRSARLQRVIMALGNTTYSSYLLHFPLQLAIALFYVHRAQAIPASSPYFMIGFVLVTFAMAEPVYRYFERPAQDWLRSRLVSKKATAAA